MDPSVKMIAQLISLLTEDEYTDLVAAIGATARLIATAIVRLPAREYEP